MEKSALQGGRASGKNLSRSGASWACSRLPCPTRPCAATPIATFVALASAARSLAMTRTGPRPTAAWKAFTPAVGFALMRRTPAAG